MSRISADVAESLLPATSDREITCPVCGGSELDDFFHLERLPVHVGMLHDSQASARLAPMGTVTLSYCNHCGMVFNRRFEPEKMTFTPGYEVQLVHSALFRAFLEEVAERLVERYDLHGKDVFDIGCGPGHFLRLLCERGGNRGIGIDPTIPREGPVPLAVGEMRLVRERFGQTVLPLDCDFASCQSVLENIPDSVSFIRNIAQTVERRRGQVYLEVFNAWRAFEVGETWSHCYEMCNSFSRRSFTEAIRRAGFEILDAGGCYGDEQYIYVEARPASNGSSGLEKSAAQQVEQSARPSIIDRFAALHSEKLREWRERIDRFRQQGQRVVVWGSGGKGICFLNTVGAVDVFRLVVDINPDRQGRHIPGTGQAVIAPNQLKADRPDVVVLTNPLYEDEIRKTVAELELTCQFVKI